MKLTFGINDRRLVIEVRSEVFVPTEPEGATAKPAIFDVSKASTQIRPQWDHEGRVPVALGFQPNDTANASI